MMPEPEFFTIRAMLKVCAVVFTEGQDGSRLRVFCRASMVGICYYTVVRDSPTEKQYIGIGFSYSATGQIYGKT